MICCKKHAKFHLRNKRAHHILDRHEDKSSFCMIRSSTVSVSQPQQKLFDFHSIHKIALCCAIQAKLGPEEQNVNQKIPYVSIK